MAKRRPVIRRLAILGATLAILGMGIYICDSLLGLQLQWRLHWLGVKLFGDPIARLCQPDDRYGWRLRPDARAKIRTPDFAVTLTIGPDGDRIVPGRPTTGPVVACLGGSFTMGTGVNDEEPYPAVLQREYWKSCQIHNMGCQGYGTAHALLRLEDEFAAGKRIDLALYGWIHHHLYRNHCRRSWLDMLAQSKARNPLFEIEDGKLVRRGLAGVDQAIPDDDPHLLEQEWQITEALLRQMQTICREHGTHLVVLILPWGQTEIMGPINQRFSRLCASLGIPYLDLTAQPELLLPDRYYPGDLHPTAAWHTDTARLIAQHTAWGQSAFRF
ncbi:MAG: hypothetical protein JXQ73_11320 [Phycisphaerae bacterium]|nr:hypothetical protein [Phycisphaerae bacterium]